MKTKQSNRLLPALVALAGVTLASSASAALFLVDFSRANGTDGVQTTSPTSGSTNAAANGLYWNNASVTTQDPTTPTGVFPTGQTISSLVSTTNVTSTMGLFIGTGWRANGLQNGGLDKDTPALGALGIASATGDYYYLEPGNGSSTSATVTITGLNPALTYNLGLFGTRNTGPNAGDIRTTSYSVGMSTINLQTSGPGAGNPAGTVATSGSGTAANGNNDDIVTFTGLVPDASNNIVITVSIVNGGFAYLGAMSIESVPEPSVVSLLGLGVLGLAIRRRRH